MTVQQVRAGVHVFALVCIAFFSSFAHGEPDFDLEHPEASADVHFFKTQPGDKPVAGNPIPQPHMYRVDYKGLEKAGEKYLVVGPFAQKGEVRITDDNCPSRLVGTKRCGRDTGRTFGVFMTGIYSKETASGPVDLKLAVASQLFTRPVGVSVYGSDGKKHAPVNSLEQDRISAQMIKFEDGYYLVAGAGAEILTHQSSFARELQTAYHSSGFARTMKGAFLYDDKGASAVNPDATVGVGTNRAFRIGSIEVRAIPQVALQVSSRKQNNQLQTSGQLSVSRGGSSITAYREHDLIPGLHNDGDVKGIRAQQCVGPRLCAFIAIDTEKSYLDRYYPTTPDQGNGSAKQYGFGVVIRGSKGEGVGRVGSIN